MPDPGPGSVGSWVIEFTTSAVGFVAAAFFTAFVIDYWVIGRNDPSWRPFGATANEALRVAVVTLVSALVGAAVAPVARVLGSWTWRRIHPAVAMLWGPLLGGLAMVVATWGSLVLVGVRPTRPADLPNWFAIGGLIAVVPWPVYLLLRMRGRRGWGGFLVAILWLATMMVAATFVSRPELLFSS